MIILTGVAFQETTNQLFTFLSKRLTIVQTIKICLKKSVNSSMKEGMLVRYFA